MTKKTTVDELETSFERVEEIEKELVPAEEKLETARQKVWRMMGGPTFGFVTLGRLRFSKSMVILGGSFLSLLMGVALFTPIIGGLFLMLAIATGVVWIKASR